MVSQTDDATSPNTYELSCVDCSFEATVEGDIFDALDAVDAHQEAYAEHPARHFVEFELEGES